jgi:regulator of protease activity HflC (stomatin/prohibitin superfamily)
MAPAIVVVVLLIFFVVTNAVYVLKEYERGVIFRLGRLGGVKGPGLVLIIPFDYP